MAKTSSAKPVPSPNRVARSRAPSIGSGGSRAGGASTLISRSMSLMAMIGPASSVSRPLGLDDFGHGHAQPIVDDHDLAAGDQAVVDVDVDRLSHLAVELDDGAAAELQKLAHLHGRLTKHGRDLDRDLVDRFQLLGVLR